MGVLLWGALGFICLVTGLLGFRHRSLLFGWIGIGGFVLSIILAALSLWKII